MAENRGLHDSKADEREWEVLCESLWKNSVDDLRILWINLVYINTAFCDDLLNLFGVNAKNVEEWHSDELSLCRSVNNWQHCTETSWSLDSCTAVIGCGSTLRVRNSLGGISFVEFVDVIENLWQLLYCMSALQWSSLQMSIVCNCNLLCGSKVRCCWNM